MSYQGFIKLHRQIIEWEWYGDINVFRLFIHFLLKANHKDNKWQGKIIKKGSFITSYENLSIETGLSVQQVRTAINKLKLTNEITYQSTSQYSIIIINNWDKFQIDNTPDNKQITNEQQTNNKQITINNNDNNVNNEKKYRERDRKILENYLLNKKRANPIDDIDAYISSFSAEDLKRKLQKAQKWQENQEKKKERSRKNEVVEHESEEEIKKAMQEAHKKVFKK